MFIRFRFSNFRCFRDLQELSLVAGPIAGRENLLSVPLHRLKLLRVAAIFGANASGKSSILDAIEFVQNAVGESHQDWKPEAGVPTQPNAGTTSKPAFFEVTFLVGDTLFEYSFRIDGERVLEEKLIASRGRKQTWFHRDSQAAEPFSFGKRLRGDNRTIARLTRPNSLFLSSAAANNHPSLGPVYDWFVKQIRFPKSEDQMFRLTKTMKDIEADATRARVLSILRSADLGIKDLALRPVPTSIEVATRFAPVRRGNPPTWLELAHTLGEEDFWLPLALESEGTKVWLALTEPLMRCLDQGGLLCVDELDASLHPLLVREIVRMFQDPERNPNGAQLIFNSHDTSLLGDVPDPAPLNREEVWLTEKGEDGASRLYPLSDYKPRREENLSRGYLFGRYGGVPMLQLLQTG